MASDADAAAEAAVHDDGGGDDDVDEEEEARVRAVVPSLSSPDAATRATAAESLLDGASSPMSWARALARCDAIVPLLALVQAVKRDVHDGMRPIECAENSDAVIAAGDAALLVLAEVANVAAQMLAEEGWDVARCDDEERAVFVDERSGMSQVAPPALASTANDAIAAVIVETLTLVTPLRCPDASTTEPRWPVRVLSHSPATATADGESARASLSVLDCALEEGDAGDVTRVMVRGPWTGSDGDVDGEVDPSEPPGTALDGWSDAAAAAALALRLAASASASAPASAPGAEPSPSPPPPRRVLVCGLRCGSIAAYLASRGAEIRVDVLEPDARVADAAREHFNLDFDDERWDDLTESGRAARLATPPKAGRARVWSGVSMEAFAAAAKASVGGGFFAVLSTPGTQRFDALLAAKASASVATFVKLVRSLLNEDDGVAVLAENDGETLGAMAVASAGCFGADAVVAAREDDDESNSNANAEPPSAKRAKTDADGAFAAAFAAPRGGVVVAVTTTNPAGLGDVATFFSRAAWARVVARLAPAPFAVDVAERLGSSASKVARVSFRAAADDADDAAEAAEAAVAVASVVPERARAAAAANAGNAGWDLFGGGDGGETAPRTAPFAWCTSFLKDFSRRHSSPALPFQRLTAKTFD